ncbi:hypothetical protein OG689_03230 [Kitasatospora sp. NBC_00240]|uniref:hypothetical protein n=1 Tax=Kitasatospora sp. NBC_00240 TaxID=2903567 RepID=UPI00224D172C|nr:hypothetical protein [Kitasatospora sp. NBC_00240]MCX5208322.1 hypothetical protein [Kitasatospora sp. NBC_00240]
MKSSGAEPGPRRAGGVVLVALSGLLLPWRLTGWCAYTQWVWFRDSAGVGDVISAGQDVSRVESGADLAFVAALPSEPG